MRLRAGLLIAPLLWGCHAGDGADVDIIGECTTCVVAIDTLWMSDPSDPNITLNTMRALAVGDSVLVLNNTHRSLVLFGPDGRTRRVVAGPGEGPGEFHDQLWDVVQLRDGSFMVLEAGRIALFDEHLTFTESRRLPVRPRGGGLVPIGDSAVVIAGRRPSDPASAPLQHLISRSGEVLGAYDTVSAPRGGTVLGPGIDGSVWLIVERTPTETPLYRLDQWDPATGRRLRSVERQPPWFEDWEPPDDPLGEPRPGQPDSPWPPTLYDAFQSSEDVLWTLTMVADPGYDYSASARSRQSLLDRIDVILEAVDPESGQLIVGHRFDTHVPGFTPTGDLVVYEEDSFGRPTLSLRSVSLLRERTDP